MLDLDVLGAAHGPDQQPGRPADGRPGVRVRFLVICVSARVVAGAGLS